MVAPAGERESCAQQAPGHTTKCLLPVLPAQPAFTFTTPLCQLGQLHAAKLAQPGGGTCAVPGPPPKTEPTATATAWTSIERILSMVAYHSALVR